LDWDESQFLTEQESRDVELNYCDSIGAEIVPLIREGSIKPPRLLALTPLASIPRRRATPTLNSAVAG